MSAIAINFFEAYPRSTAKEAGLTTAEANALVGAGKLMQAGHRKTGKKGRPPIEYVVIGYDLTDDPQAQEAVREAQARVDDHRRWERLSGVVMRAANEHGTGSDEHVDAKLARYEAFPFGIPPLPGPNDWVLAGVTVELEDLPALLPDEEAELVEAGEWHGRNDPAF